MTNLFLEASLGENLVLRQSLCGRSHLRAKYKGGLKKRVKRKKGPKIGSWKTRILEKIGILAKSQKSVPRFGKKCTRILEKVKNRVKHRENNHFLTKLLKMGSFLGRPHYDIFITNPIRLASCKSLSVTA